MPSDMTSWARQLVHCLQQLMSMLFNKFQLKLARVDTIATARQVSNVVFCAWPVKDVDLADAVASMQPEAALQQASKSMQHKSVHADVRQPPCHSNQQCQSAVAHLRPSCMALTNIKTLAKKRGQQPQSLSGQRLIEQHL